VNEALVRRFLSLEDHPLRVRIDARHIEELVRGYLDWPGAYSPAHDSKEPPEPAEGRVLLRYLGETLANLTDRVARLEAGRARYLVRAEAATHRREQTDLVLDFAKELGSTGRQLRGDRAALRRWFDLGAVLDRCDERRAAHEQRLAIVLRRVGPLAAWLLRHEVHQVDPERTWRELALERLLLPVFAYPGDARVRLEAFRALLEAISALPSRLHEGSLSDETVRLVYRAAIGREEPLWVQREALTFLPAIDPRAFERALGLRIRNPFPGDDLFVRSRAVQLLGERFERVADARELLERAASDPSPRVRQAVAGAAERSWQQGGRELLGRLLVDDPAPPVRAAAVLALETPGRDAGRRAEACDLLDRVLASESEPFVVRTALHVLQCLAGEPGLGAATPETAALARRFLPGLEELHVRHPSLSVRRWAAQTREHLWCRSRADVEEALARVRELQAATREGESRPVSDLGLAGTLLGRALSTAPSSRGRRRPASRAGIDSAPARGVFSTSSAAPTPRSGRGTPTSSAASPAAPSGRPRASWESSPRRRSPASRGSSLRRTAGDPTSRFRTTRSRCSTSAATRRASPSTPRRGSRSSAAPRGCGGGRRASRSPSASRRSRGRATGRKGTPPTRRPT
jgi:hypothetical protein